MTKSKTVVKDSLLILAGLDEDLGLLTKWQKKSSQNKLVGRLGERQSKALLKYLQKYNYIKQDQSDKLLTLTTKGWQKIALVMSEKLGKRNVQGPLKYIIIFDIPEDHRRIRDLLRECLITIGFRFLQYSIFITNSREAFKFAEQLVHNCGFKNYVRFIIVEKTW